MKKSTKSLTAVLILVLVAVFAISSCNSNKEVNTPPPPPPPPAGNNDNNNPPPPPPPVYTPENTEAAIADLYDRHEKDIILDNATTYTVKAGDTLTSIAREHYGDSYVYPLILIVNRHEIPNHDLIEIGMVLTLPVLDLNLEDSQARSSLKIFYAEMAAIEASIGREATAQGLWEESGKM